MAVPNSRRILFVSPFNEPLSGADESLVLLVDNFVQQENVVFVMVPEDSAYAQRYEQAGAIVIARRMSRMRRTYNPVFWTKFFRTFISERREMKEWMIQHQIDLVHLNMHVSLGPLLAAKSAGIPSIIHYRAKTNDRPKWFFDLFLPFLVKRTSATICISHAVADHFKRRGIDLHVSVIHNALDFSRFEEGIEKNPYEQEEMLRGKRVILFVGRLHPQKRIHLLLDAFGQLSNTYSDLGLAIVGEGAKEDKVYEVNVRARASDQGLNVKFFGQQQNVRPFMSHANALVLPSVDEGFGRVLIEAMALGIPVVGAQSGAIPEVLDYGKFGYLFTRDEVADLATKLEHAINEDPNHELRASRRAYAKREFSIDTHLKRVIEVYDRVLS